MINTSNLLLVTDSALLGSQRFVKIDRIEGLPAQSQDVPVLRAEVTANDDGVTTLRLADGTLFKARITPLLPVGSRLTFSPQPDNTATLLRYLPPSRDSAAQSHTGQPTPQPANLPPQTPLIQIAVKLPSVEGPPPLPQIGNTIALSVEPGKPTPAVGATVLGQILGEPSSGTQTLELTNKTKLQIPVPPIFPPRVEVQLKILTPQTARIERINTPILANLPQQTQAAPLQQQPLQAGQTPALQQGVQPQQQGINAPRSAGQSTPALPLVTDVRSLSALPTVQGQNPQPLNGVTLPADGPDVSIVKLDTGQVIKLNTATPLTEGQPVAIRIRADGLVDILPVTPITAVKNSVQHGAQQQLDRQPHTNTPSAPQKEGPAPAMPQVHQATVHSRIDAATYQLRFDNGLTVQVHSERPLHTGAQLSVKITPDGHAEIIHIALPKATNPKAAGLLNFALGWPNLTKAIHALEAANPDAANDLKSRLPALNEAALPNLMRFSEAIATRNAEVLFGRETLNVLRALGLDGALTNDLNTLHTLQQKSDQPDMWRGMIFPYWNEEDDTPRQGQFFWRNQKDEHNKSDKEHVRFVINFSLSKLGSLQLDGLVNNRDMHLKLRMIEPLTDDQLTGLKKTVDNALQEANLTGGIDVEAVHHFDVDPVHDIVATQKNLDLEI